MRKIDELEPDLLLLDIIFPVDEKEARADRLDYEAGISSVAAAISSPVTTACTPGMASASDVSIDLMRARG